MRYPETPKNPETPKTDQNKNDNNENQTFFARLEQNLQQRTATGLDWMRDRLPSSATAFLGLDRKLASYGVSPRVKAMRAGAGVVGVGLVSLVAIGAFSGAQQPGVDPTAQQAALDPSQAQASTLSGGGSTESGSTDPDLEQPNDPNAPQAVGIDVSNHNKSIDWAEVAKTQQFAFVLSSDGTDFSSPKFAEQYQGAKDAGMKASAYHFARPDESAEAQADLLLKNAPATQDGKTLPHVLDLEVDAKGDSCYGKTPGQMEQWINTFNDKIKQAGGQEPIIYSSTSFWNECMADSQAFKDSPLWLASYGVDNPKLPSGWNQYHFWQYTDKGKVNGMDGPVDMNKFHGTTDDLEDMAK